MKNRRYQIAIFASGNGSNAEVIIRYFQHHPLVGVCLVLSNNPQASVLQRAEQFEVPFKVFDRLQWRESEVVLQWLSEVGATHIVLAGFMWLLPVYLIKAFPDRIVNIHPALLPKYGGKGMYGMKVHEAVLIHREVETGITIHLVNEHYDEGLIIFQKTCTIEPSDSAATVAAKVQALEHEHYPRVIEKWIVPS